MIPIKIECACGQHYAFDVDPVDGRMPRAVACPACGADGTRTADGLIRDGLPQPPTPKPVVRVREKTTPLPAASAAAFRASHTTTLSRARVARPGQVELDQVEVEARAKVFWGDSRHEVIKYLMMNGYDAGDASDMVREMHRERAATIWRKGLRKTLVGAAMISLPVAVFLVSASVGFMSIKLLGVTGAVGLWGAWIAFDGLVMLFSPGSESGDVADK